MSVLRQLYLALVTLLPKSLRFGSREENLSPSMVLLQRQSRDLDGVVLEAAADRAWNLGLSGGNKPAKYFVQCEGPRAVMSAGPALLHFLHNHKVYLDLNEAQLLRFLPDAERRDLWRAHEAWVAIDWHGVDDAELAYAVLAALVSELLDTNTVGVYVPGEQAFAPNDDSLYASLKQIANSREFIVK